MNPLSIASFATGLIGGIGSLFGRGSANRKMEELMKQDPTYNINPVASKRYNLASTMLNARTPGAINAEKNVYRNEANQLGRLQRNATDSSQLLALGAAAQGQSNQSFENIANNEAEDWQRRFQNYSAAGDSMIREGDKAYDDQVRRFNDKVQFQGAKNQNNQSNWQSISNLGFGLSDFGLSGGMNYLFGGNGNSPYSPTIDDISSMPRMPYSPTTLPYGH